MLKVVTVGGRRVYIYPTIKGMVSEAGEVRQAFERIHPTAIGLSASERELAEVRFALKEDGEAPEKAYTPESRRSRAVAAEDDDEKGKKDKAGGSDEKGADEGDDVAAGEDDEVETSMGPVTRKELGEAIDEPFAPDLMAADSATKGDRIFVSDTDMTMSRKLAAFGDVELPPPSFREAVTRADGRGLEVVPLDLNDDEYTMIFCDHVTYWQLVRHSRAIKRMRHMRASSPEDLVTQWDARVRAIPGYGVLERERERRIAHTLLELMGRSERVLAVVDLPLVEGVVANLTALAKGEAPKA